MTVSANRADHRGKDGGIAGAIAYYAARLAGMPKREEAITEIAKGMRQARESAKRGIDDGALAGRIEAEKRALGNYGPLEKDGAYFQALGRMLEYGRMLVEKDPVYVMSVKSALDGTGMKGDGWVRRHLVPAWKKLGCAGQLP